MDTAELVKMVTKAQARCRHAFSWKKISPTCRVATVIQWREAMTVLVKTMTAVAISVVLANGAFAQNAMNIPQIEHHVAKVDGVLFPLRNGRDRRSGFADPWL